LANCLAAGGFISRKPSATAIYAWERWRAAYPGTTGYGDRSTPVSTLATEAELAHQIKTLNEGKQSWTPMVFLWFWLKGELILVSIAE
jgi:hypothetical protein